MAERFEELVEMTPWEVREHFLDWPRELIRRLIDNGHREAAMRVRLFLRTSVRDAGEAGATAEIRPGDGSVGSMLIEPDRASKGKRTRLVCMARHPRISKESSEAAALLRDFVEALRASETNVYLGPDAPKLGEAIRFVMARRYYAGEQITDESIATDLAQIGYCSSKGAWARETVNEKRNDLRIPKASDSRFQDEIVGRISRAEAETWWQLRLRSFRNVTSQ